MRNSGYPIKNVNLVILVDLVDLTILVNLANMVNLVDLPILVNLANLVNLVKLVILVNLELDMVILVNLCENMIFGILESPPSQKYSICWSGLVWSGLVWSGLVWSGLVWSRTCCQDHILTENI